MGISHLSMINAHPRVQVVGICDPAGYVLDLLNKYTGLATYKDFDDLLAQVDVEAVIVATPSNVHGAIVRAALERGLHVFCEKPFCLNTTEGKELVRLADLKGVVTQVGYHNRFVGAFQEVKRLLDVGAIGRVTHVLAEAYGPVVLQSKGSTWRTRRTEGGGCMFDYAAHPINLVNWYLGSPSGVGGSVLGHVFSEDTDDEVFSTLFFPEGKTAQISVNWSDEACRKMTTKVTIWGTAGRIYADRQECQLYLRNTAVPPPGYRHGWNVRYTTDLTDPVWFYVRGEEYSAQLDHFVTSIEQKATTQSSFADAYVTDQAIEMIIADAANGPTLSPTKEPAGQAPKRHGFFRSIFGGSSKSPGTKSQ